MSHTILVVDDDRSCCEAMATLLMEAGYDVLTSSNVPSALEVLTASRPDLLITDVRLDAYNGLQLIAMAPKPIPAIVVTGFADPSIEADARRLGAEFLVKPVAPAILCEHIARMLARAEPHGVFMGTRRAPRQRLTTPVSVRVGPQLGRLVEVSATGVRLEVHGAGGGELPDLLTLHIVAFGVRVPVDVVWKRRKDLSTWVCGATIADEVEPQWRAFLNTL